MLRGQRLTKEQALQKIKHFCSYQERSHKEVKDKLYTFGLYKSEVEQLATQLIEDDYLNEERFAKQFAGGKFRMKSWGRIKIVNELKQRQVSSYCIKLGLREIDEDNYISTLQKLALKKWDTLKCEKELSRRAKVFSYLLQKGYEAALIQKIIGDFKNM